MSDPQIPVQKKIERTRRNVRRAGNTQLRNVCTCLFCETVAGLLWGQEVVQILLLSASSQAENNQLDGRKHRKFQVRNVRECSRDSNCL